MSGVSPTEHRPSPDWTGKLRTWAQSRYEKIPLPLLERAIDYTLQRHKIAWEQKSETEIAALFQEALGSTIVYHGPGTPHAPSANLETPRTHVGEIVDYLLGHDYMNPAWLNWKHINGIFFSADKDLMSGMQKEFREVLANACQDLPPKSEAEETLFRAFIGNVIAFYPILTLMWALSSRFPKKLMAHGEPVAIKLIDILP